MPKIVGNTHAATCATSHCNKLQHTLNEEHSLLAEYRRVLATHTATYCNTNCSTLHRTLQHALEEVRLLLGDYRIPFDSNAHCNTHCNTHCNAQCNTHCITLQHTLKEGLSSLGKYWRSFDDNTHCNVLRHTNLHTVTHPPREALVVKRIANVFW